MTTHVFGVETLKEVDAEEFFADSALRARGPGLHDYFARWMIISIRCDNPDRFAWAVVVDSYFVDAWKIAAAIALLPLLWTGFVWSWWIVPGFALWVLSFLSSSTMRYIAMRIALRKNGYHGLVKRLSASEVLKRMVEKEWDSDK